MENKKTDMLTVEQFNEKVHNKRSNCIGFALGTEECVELDYVNL